MSLLSQLKPNKGATHSRKRKGRGEASGLGKTAGRGHKGQKSRSSPHIHPGFEGGQMPLHRRSPKWGFNQKDRHIFATVNLGSLNEKFGANDQVTPESLKEKGLIRNLRLPVKILAKGRLKHSLNISAHAFSEAAKKQIESAKGNVQVLTWKPTKAQAK